MVNDWMYGAASQSGWWMGPYSTGGDSHEGILRNTGALKNGISMLGEARAAGGATRPAEGGTNSRANEHRKVYAHLWENWEGMRYFNARMPQIRGLDRAVGRLPDLRRRRRRTVLRGSYPWPLVPSVGENPNDQPDVDTPLASPDPRPGAVRLLHPADRVHAAPTRQLRPGRAARLADPRHQGRAAGRRRARPAQAALRRPGRADPRLRGGAADDHHRAAPLLVPEDRRCRSAARSRRRCRSTLGAPAAFGPFTPGVAKDYTATTTATVISTAGDATLTASDPSTTAPGRLVNGAFALASPLQVAGTPLAPSTVKTLRGAGVQRQRHDRLQAVDRRERAAAHGHVREDADVHALDDEPVRVTFTLARWGLAPAREGVNVARSVTFVPRLGRLVSLSVTLVAPLAVRARGRSSCP